MQNQEQQVIQKFDNFTLESSETVKNVKRKKIIRKQQQSTKSNSLQISLKKAQKLSQQRKNQYITISLLNQDYQSYISLVQKPFPSTDLFVMKQAKNQSIEWQIANEVNFLEQLQNKSDRIIKLIDYQLKDQCYMILEYGTRGNLLQELQKNGSFSDKLVRYYFKQLLEGVETLHSNNIFHKDLKLENIVLDKDCQLKIIDLGFASDSDAKVMGTSGSPQYVPPQINEQNQWYTSSAQDLFALGVCLFIMKIGDPPFYQATKENVHYKHIYENDFKAYWKLMHKIAPKKAVFSEGFQDLIEKMLACKEEQRWNLKQIKQHPWVLGESYSTVEEVLKEYETRFN